MDNPVPFAVRLAAGLIATGVDRVRTLPEDLPGWSVSLAGEIAKFSLKVQQEIASLAAAGDEVIESFTRRPEEQPAWAHFDEDDDGVGDNAADDNAADDNGADNITSHPADSVGDEVHDAPAGPSVMPEYDGLRIAQVRARMIALDAAGIRQLLDHELSHLARASVVTMLQNRLVTLGATR